MSILIKPIITEKATADSEMNNCYTFLVNPSSNKVEIKKAVEATYGVSVEKVRTLRYGVERKTRYTKQVFKTEKQTAPRKQSFRLPKGMLLIFIVIFNSVTCQLEN